MKVYIVTSDDIEDGYPTKAFDTNEKAEAYTKLEKQAKKDIFYSNRQPQYSHIEWKESMYYAEIVEFEVE